MEPVTDRTAAVVKLADAQRQVAEGLSKVAVSVEDNVHSTTKLGHEVKLVRRWLVPLIALAVAAGIAAAGTFWALRGVVKHESNAQQTEFKCVVGVLFRQDPPACPGLKEEMIRDGVLPPGFPATTTTRP